MLDARPLILLTRPQAASESFAADLAARIGTAARTIIAPVIAIESMGDPIATDGYAGVIFTSANAIPMARAPVGQAAYCVGDATAAEAAAQGFTAHSAAGDAAALVRMLLDRRPPAPLLHLRGAHGRGLADDLTAGGIATTEAVVYRQAEVAIPADVRAAVEQARLAILPVFSPRSARLLREQIGPADGLHVVAISPAAAEAWGPEATAVQEPTRDSILEAIAEFLDSDSP